MDIIAFSAKMEKSLEITSVNSPVEKTKSMFMENVSVHLELFKFMENAERSAQKMLTMTTKTTVNVLMDSMHTMESVYQFQHAITTKY